MRKIFLGALWLGGSLAFAQGGDFTEMKERMLKKTQERKKSFEEAEACIQKATTKQELHKCRPRGPRGHHGKKGMMGNKGEE